MKTLASLLAVFLALAASSQAVTWINCTVSIAVQQGGPTITKTLLSSRTYLAEGAQRFGDPVLKNYFIGFRADTGQVAVVHIPSETVVYNIVSGLNQAGFAANGINTIGTLAGNATVSSLNVDFANSYFIDKVRRKTDGSVSSVARAVTGGAGNLVVTGTIRASGKRYEL